MQPPVLRTHPRDHHQYPSFGSVFLHSPYKHIPQLRSFHFCKINLFDHLLHATCSEMYNLSEWCASRQAGTANYRHGEWRWLVNTRAPLADWASRVHTALSRLPPFLSSFPTSEECFDFWISKSSKTLENSPMPTDVNQLTFRLLSMTILLSACAAEKFGEASANCFPLMTRGNISSAPKAWTNVYWSSVYVRSKK